MTRPLDPARTSVDEQLIGHLVDQLWSLRALVLLTTPVLALSLVRLGHRRAAVVWFVGAALATLAGLWVVARARAAEDRRAWCWPLVAIAATSATAWSSTSLIVDARTVPSAIIKFLPPIVIMGSTSVMFAAHLRSFAAAIAAVAAIYTASALASGTAVILSALPGFYIAVIMFSTQAVWSNRSLRAQIGARQRAVELTTSLIAEQQATLAANEAMRRLAERDPLTGAYNRRYLTEHADALSPSRRADATTVHLAMLDLDHFKVTNDRHGHATGDLVLKELVRCADEALPPDSVLARWGGEEFVLVITADRRSVVDALGRLRARFADQTATDTATFSAGVVEWTCELTFDDALRRADAALYQAKADGRDRTIVVGDRSPVSGR